MPTLFHLCGPTLLFVPTLCCDLFLHTCTSTGCPFILRLSPTRPLKTATLTRGFGLAWHLVPTTALDRSAEPAWKHAYVQLLGMPCLVSLLLLRVLVWGWMWWMFLVVPVCMSSCKLPPCVSAVQAGALASRLAVHTTTRFAHAIRRAFESD